MSRCQRDTALSLRTRVLPLIVAIFAVCALLILQDSASANPEQQISDALAKRQQLHAQNYDAEALKEIPAANGGDGIFCGDDLMVATQLGGDYVVQKWVIAFDDPYNQYLESYRTSGFTLYGNYSSTLTIEFEPETGIEFDCKETPALFHIPSGKTLTLIGGEYSYLSGSVDSIADEDIDKYGCMGAFDVMSGGSLNLESELTVQNCVGGYTPGHWTGPNGFGGAITLQPGATATVACTIDNCKGTMGGAIAVKSGATLTLKSGAYLSGCRSVKAADDVSTGRGGGVCVQGGTLNMEYGYFSACSAQTCGGGLYITGQSNGYVVNGIRFYGCRTDGAYGGGLVIENCSGALEVRSSNFENCHADNGTGGAIWFGQNDSGETVQGCKFTGCAAKKGAAVCWDDALGHALTVKDSTFTDCLTGLKPDGGGVVDVTNASKCDFTGLTISMSEKSGFPEPGSAEDEEAVNILTPEGSGAALYLRNAGAATVSADISGMNRLGGGVVAEDTNLQLKGSITGCTTGSLYSRIDATGVQELGQNDCGGAVRIITSTGDYSTTLDGVTISKCKAVAGGAICVKCEAGSTSTPAVTLKNVQISSCKSWDCGTLFVQSGKVQMTGGSIKDCTRSDGPGQAVCLRKDGSASPELSMSDVAITGCTGIGTGVVYAGPNCKLDMNTCTVTKNPGNSLGTLYVANSATANLVNTIIEAGENCFGSGSCVMTAEGSKLTVDGGHMTAIQYEPFLQEGYPAADYGGCIFARGTVNIDGAELIGTFAAAGGVLYANEKSSVTIGAKKPVTIRNGTASNVKLTGMQYCCSGGAICSDSKNLTIMNTTFKDCAAINPAKTDTPCGGAICVISGITNVNNCTMQNCQAGSGGAIAVINGAFHGSNNTFIDCSADLAGGALYATGGEVALKQTTAQGCTAQSGAVVALSPTKADLAYEFDGYVEGDEDQVTQNNVASNCGEDLYLDYMGTYARVVIDGGSNAKANAGAQANANDALHRLSVRAAAPQVKAKRYFFVGSDELAPERAAGTTHNIENTSNLSYVFASDNPQLGIVDDNGNSDFEVATIVVIDKDGKERCGFAEFPGAVAFAEGGDTIKVLASANNLDSIIVTNKGTEDNPLIFDLNGKKLTAVGKCVLAPDYSHLRIIDSSVGQTGAMCCKAERYTPEEYVLRIYDKSSVVMESGNIVGDWGGVSLEKKYTKFRMTGGMVVSHGDHAEGIRLLASNCLVDLSGGEVHGARYIIATEEPLSENIVISGDAVLQGDGSASYAVYAALGDAAKQSKQEKGASNKATPGQTTVDMQGGTICGVSRGFEGVSLVVSDGRVAASKANWGSYCAVDHSVSGGRFSFEVEEAALAEGATCAYEPSDTECPYVVNGDPGCVINTTTGKHYATLQEAFDDVSAGQMLVLQCNILGVDESLVLKGKGTSDNPVTLDLNGFIIEGMIGGMYATGNTFIAQVDDAALALIDSDEAGRGTIRNTASVRGSAVHLDNTANLNVQSGNVECPGAFPIAGATGTTATQLVFVSGGRIVGAGKSNWSGCTVDHSVTGGHFSAQVKDAELVEGYVCGASSGDSQCKYQVKRAGSDWPPSPEKDPSEDVSSGTGVPGTGDHSLMLFGALALVLLAGMAFACAAGVARAPREQD